MTSAGRDRRVEVDMRRLVGYAAVGFAREEAADVFFIDARAAFTQFKAGPVHDGHSDDIAADLARIGFGDEIQNGDRADNFRAVDRALQQQGRSLARRRR